MWKSIGKALATTAKYTAKGALWASDHQEVVGTIATIAGHPEVAAAVAGISQVREAVARQKEAENVAKSATMLN